MLRFKSLTAMGKKLMLWLWCLSSSEMTDTKAIDHLKENLLAAVWTAEGLFNFKETF